MSLKFEVYVAPQIDVNASITLPIVGVVKWSPIACTLIYGDKEAVLIDTPITIEQNRDLADWVKSKLGSRKLTYLYITHGHADHFLGIALLQKRFPGLHAVATPDTVEHMKDQLSPAVWNDRWAVFFAGRVPDVSDIVLAAPLSNLELTVDGHLVKVLELGHTDTHSSTAVFVPDLELAVCGDCVYGDVHQMLREANTTEKRQEWIAAVETIKALNPKWVVAGHKRSDGEDSPKFLDTTVQYIRDFEQIIQDNPGSSSELFNRMMKKHGARLNPDALEVGCHAAFGIEV